jgi:hypothetical protein
MLAPAVMVVVMVLTVVRVVLRRLLGELGNLLLLGRGRNRGCL